MFAFGSFKNYVAEVLAIKYVQMEFHQRTKFETGTFLVAIRTASSETTREHSIDYNMYVPRNPIEKWILVSILFRVFTQCVHHMNRVRFVDSILSRHFRTANTLTD